MGLIFWQSQEHPTYQGNTPQALRFLGRETIGKSHINLLFNFQEN